MPTIEKLKNFLLGRPLSTQQITHERLSNPQGLAIFASDNLSSSAYATEEILLVLVLAGSAALAYSIPLAIVITLLITIVTISYRQTIHAYPQGGGGYSVAKDNLGGPTALVVAAALLTDYILTSAVSISAGVAAMTSAFPAILPWKVWLAIGTMGVLAWGNLRGVRASGKMFALPTYFFLVSLLGLIGYGAWRYLTGTFPPPLAAAAAETNIFTGITLFLILRAFASGCVALTGIEATANGVQAFRPPEAKNAANTLMVMALLLGTIFLGITILAYFLHIMPNAEETVVSQTAAALLGRTPFYFFVQFATAIILLLAANTPFQDFPRVGAILAKDRYFPHQFAQLGSRLVYSGGIFALSSVTALLIFFFRADTHRLIPLYAVGVFLVFTISQFGMVKHWRKRHTHGAHPWNARINAIGGTITLIVLLIVFGTKFRYGAWLLVPAIFFLVLLMRAIRSHYDSVAEQLSLKNPIPRIPKEKTVIVLVSGVHVGTLKAVEFAKSLHAAHLKAIHIALEDVDHAGMRKRWKQYVPDIHLDVVSSPYRDLIGPLIQYIEGVERRWENDTVIVVIPEFVPTKFWHHWLHNQTAKQIRWALEHREDVEIVDVPYRLKEPTIPKTFESIFWRGFVETIAIMAHSALWIVTAGAAALRGRFRKKKAGKIPVRKV